MRIVCVAVSVPALSQVMKFKEKYRKDYPDDHVEIELFYVADMEERFLMSPERLIEAISCADIAVIDTMGASEALQNIVREGLEACKGQRLVIGNTLREYLRLGSFSMGAMRKKKTEDKKDEETKNAASVMHQMRRMALMLGNVLPFGITKDMKNVFRLMDYWQQASEEDITSFMHLLLRQYGKRKFLPKEKACTMRYGIYLKHPMTHECEERLSGYWKKYHWNPEQSGVALLFYGHSYPNDFMPVIEAFYKELDQDYNILPIAFSQNEDGDLEILQKYLCQDRYPISAVINLMPFRLGAGPMGGDADRAVSILKELDVPYIKPFCLTKTDADTWDHSDAVNPGEFLISVLLPELDGGILTLPVGVMSSAGDGVENRDLPEILPIEERIHTVCKRMTAWIRLRNMENKDKKAALIFYNYPSGENNIFGGAFLDTFATAAELLKAFKSEGYCTDIRSKEELMARFIEGGLCNEPVWSDEEERSSDIPVKGICCGNLFLGIQPVRGEDYHDRNQEPPEAYQTFYRWIQEDFQADVIIHVGTHGTLEFLPGKDNGMMGSCWPDRLMGNTPHIYYYYIGNPSEAMIAKRRSNALLISYEAPPLKKSGLYGKYAELKETIAEYRESIQSAPERSRDLLDRIGELALETGIFKETLTEKVLDYLDEVLYEYEMSLITDGLHVINNVEISGLMRALNGRYIPVGTAGDVVKNPDILPSGRNLVQFDPRLVPTRTAYERGGRIAEKTIEKFVNEQGRYPNTTAVILWGLETSRSQGETIGQIMYYLGIRLKTEKSSYDDRFEIIPLEELGRPRIDVVIHICGFFRDMYPNLVDNLNAMFSQLLNLGEKDEWNYYAANTHKMVKKFLKQGMEPKEAEELAGCRIFGPKAGEYGTRLTETVRKGNWADAAELGTSFTADLSYAYTNRRRGTGVPGLLEQSYDHVDFMSQVRNNVEYELTDLDHYYEFYGGLAKAIENVKGEKAAMYVADTTGETEKVQDIGEALQRGIATRLLNPSWIEGMMRHDYHGVQQIEKRFENVMGFAVSTDRIESAAFSQLAQCYAGNEELRHRMQQSNKWAYMKMMERLMEAENRGYYHGTEEELSWIREAYLEAEGDAEQ